MRSLPFILISILTVALIVSLNKSWDKVPALGKFLSPQHGFWKNAEPADKDLSDDMRFPQLAAGSHVYFDERLVPHIFSEVETDAYFIEGYLHAKFRLWQMEMQTYAAAGRISEVAGPRTLQFDRQQRRLGMVFAAKNLLREIEADPVTKKVCDQYTAGVNAYIGSLSDRDLPLEYKLLGYRPEKWTNLKVALFIKQMAKTLGSSENDLAMTYAKNFFNEAQLKILFPQVADSLDPIVPAGTVFGPAKVSPVKPADADSAYLNNYNIIPLGEVDKPDPANGSNNWAVSGSRTKSGKPILANDPHLELTLPSVWFELQIKTPGMNVYGVSFPGCPGVTIGFNDHIAWGVTNSGRDVRDYYEVKFKDKSKSEYWFNNNWKKVDSQRIEEIRVKGGKTFYDTVAYIDQGPVIFDHNFVAALSPQKSYAVRWMAHEAGNEMLAFNKLNHAKNYDEYLSAIKLFICPAQNFAFASVSGDIALWQQGKFPARWDRQGLYIMPYYNDHYKWQGFIPQEDNPHLINPERGFVSSANQRSAAKDYPYFIPGEYDLYRGIRINKRLASMSSVTPQDMMNLQKDNFNTLAETSMPLFLKYLQNEKLSAGEKEYADTIISWNYFSEPNLVAPTLFKIWYDSLESFIWHDELRPLTAIGLNPHESTLIEALLRDSAFSYIDDVNTKEKESIKDAITVSFKKAVGSLQQLAKNNHAAWGTYKNTTLYHLLGQELLPFARTGLQIGGGTHIINATQHNHGPSWKMVVELTTPIQAWVIYPGGQSGNPGGRYYDNFVSDYASGKYYKAWVMSDTEKGDHRISSTLSFNKK
ncbi:MAG TPA: penicillin acylase family protein [Flavitalea sp.]|nr:penicillin acylase family protein [Flavitalea sp.]